MAAMHCFRAPLGCLSSRLKQSFLTGDTNERPDWIASEDLVDAQALVAAAPHATLARIEGMNHILVDALPDRAENIATYGNPSLPLDAKLGLARSAIR
jgi:hypothetical protein